MKKLVLISFLLMLGSMVTFAGGNGGGNHKINPIPSFNVLVEGATGFYEMNTPPPSKAKRQMNVRTTSISPKNGIFPVTIWLTTDMGTVVMGPYVINVGETLVQQIDNRKWGAVVTSDYPVTVDVWIDDGSALY